MMEPINNPEEAKAATQAEGEASVSASGIELDMTPDEYREHLQTLAKSRDQLEGEIHDDVEELESLLFNRNPLSVIGNLWFRNSITDPDNYKEYEHEGSDAFTEYVTTVYLTREFDLGEGGGVEPLRPSELEEIQDYVKRIFTYTMMQHGLKDVDPENAQPPGAFGELRFRTLTHKTAVRYDAYALHLKRTLRGILEPLDDLLEEHLGFTAENAILLSEVVQDISENGLRNLFERARGAIEDLLAAVEEYEREGEVSESHDQEMIEYGAGLDPESRRRWAIGMMSTWASTFMGLELLFTAEELAEEAGVSIEQAEAFARRMSLHFGDVDPQWYREPSATPPLQVQPLVRLRPDENPIEDQEAFFCPVPQSVLWALRNNIEAALNPSGSQEHASLRLQTASEDTWNRYEQSRSSYTESRAAQLFSQLLPGATVHENMKYDAPDEQGEISETELDGLVLLDDSLFLVEVKAGTLTPPARRGAPSLREELNEIIRKGHEQALRAQTYIETNDPPTFRRGNGVEWTVPKEKVSRTFLIVVALEDLSVFGPNLYDLRRADLLADGAWPWCVSLTDLEVFAEIFDSPSEFIHFLKNRLEVASKGKIMAADELDWLGCYLEKGLDLDISGADWIQLDTAFTEGIDAYFMYEYGSREEPAPKPKQPLPTPLREVIDEIEEERPDGFYRMAEIILDFPHGLRAKVAERMYEARVKAAGEGKRAGATFLNPTRNSGITYQVLPAGSDGSELKEVLDSLCTIRKYQMKADQWIGLGYVINGSPRWLHCVIFNDKPWEHNPDLEERIKEAPPSIRQSFEPLEQEDKE